MDYSDIKSKLEKMPAGSTLVFNKPIEINNRKFNEAVYLKVIDKHPHPMIWVCFKYPTKPNHNQEYHTAIPIDKIESIDGIVMAEIFK